MGKRSYILGCITLMVISIFILGWSYLQVIRNDAPQELTLAKRDLYTRTDTRGEVSVSAKWLNPLETNATTVIFDISLDTHSINLDQYDFNHNTKVSINNQVVTTGIDVEKKGAGHHVTYSVEVLMPKIANSNPLRNIQLTIMNLDNVPERVFTWNS